MYLGQLKGLSKKDALEKSKHWLDKLDLADRWNQTVETLSKGLQQQVQFIATVLHEPKLLILDEPFSGLDPVNTNRLKAEIRQLKAAGTSIIFSTHRMEQVEEICEHIALINQGKKVLEGVVDNIQEQYKPHHYEIQFRGALNDTFRAAFEIVRENQNEVVVAWPEGHSPKTLLSNLLEFDVEIRSFQEILPSLNEIFIRIVHEKSLVSHESSRINHQKRILDEGSSAIFYYCHFSDAFGIWCVYCRNQLHSAI